MVTNPQESHELANEHTDGTCHEASDDTEEGGNDEEAKGLVEQTTKVVTMTVLVVMMMATLGSLAMFMMHEWWTAIMPAVMTTSVTKLAGAAFAVAVTLEPTFCGLGTAFGSSDHSLHTSSDDGS